MSDAYHESRFAPDAKRDVLWDSLWKFFFADLVSPEDTVLDLGCGYGNFINSVTARRRIALDSWAGSARYLSAGIQFLHSSVTNLAGVGDASVDFAFASNVFEHVTKEDFSVALTALRRKLSSRGTLTILQPNYRYASSEYFDDFTHCAVWSHVSLADFLRAHDYEIISVEPRFLPLTVKSSLPVWPGLIWLYLHLPVRPFGKQMLVRARPTP